MAIDGNVEVFWITSTELMVKVDGKEYRVTPEEAYALFKDNEKVIEKYNDLVSIKEGEKEPSFEDTIDVQFALPFGIDGNPEPIEDKKLMVEEEITRLIDYLDLKPAKDGDLMTQLENCCKLQRYMATTFSYQESIMDKKEVHQPDDIITNELFDGLINKQSVSTTNSIIFREVLSRVGMDVLCVGAVSSETSGMHMINLVELDGKYYFFDVTLENTIYQENKANSDIVLCCCGLGSETYSKFYQPQVVLPKDPNGKILPVPTNISQQDIPNQVVNMFNINPDNPSKNSANQI